MRKVLYISFIFSVILSSCEIYPDAFFTVDKVQAYIGEEIYFTNDSYNSVEGANVRLYPSLSDWDRQEDMVAEGNTNSNGKVIFYGLGPYVYYVDVWEEFHNNWDLRGYMDDIYIRTDQLVANEINTFIAWVDYTGGKGMAERDRSLVIRKLERKPKK